MADKLAIPAWLNPDAVLGAVRNINDGDSELWVLRVDPRDDTLLVAFNNGYGYPCTDWENVCECVLLEWPVKPELAALFGKGGE